MRSCEYLKTTGERRTQSLRLCNLVFRRKNKIVPHDDLHLDLADTVTVTFEYQKRDLCDDAVTQSRSGGPLLCPVRAAAAIIQRLRQMGAKPSTFIYKYKNEKGWWHTSNQKLH